MGVQGGWVRCPRCGNENLDMNRYCGMCGATLLTAPAPVASGAAQSTTASGSGTTASGTGGAPPRTPSSGASSSGTGSGQSANGRAESPGISGPSFLGLNDPPPRKRASLSADGQGPSSRNLDYLLDDDEEPAHGGAGKVLMILLALALAAGLGYLRWKGQGFAWLSTQVHKPTAAVQNPDGSDAGTTASGTSASAPTTPAGDASAPAANAAPTNPPANTTAPAAGATPADNAAAGGAASTTAAPSDASGSNPPSSHPSSSNSSPDASSTTPAAKPAAPPANDAASAPPKKAADETAAKPPAAVKPAKPYDVVAEAQKYIYGKGVTQNCDRGMKLLKPAADKGDSKAMIEMGALYSAGLCTPHDLPTAYRWFAIALRKDPNNQAVASDLQKLWGEMTQPERQLAVRLSQ